MKARNCSPALLIVPMNSCWTNWARGCAIRFVRCSAQRLLLEAWRRCRASPSSCRCQAASRIALVLAPAVVCRHAHGRPAACAWRANRSVCARRRGLVMGAFLDRRSSPADAVVPTVTAYRRSRRSLLASSAALLADLDRPRVTVTSKPSRWRSGSSLLVGDQGSSNARGLRAGLVLFWSPSTSIAGLAMAVAAAPGRKAQAERRRTTAWRQHRIRAVHVDHQGRVDGRRSSRSMVHGRR